MSVGRDLELFISQIRERFATIRNDSPEMESFFLHLRSLGQGGREPGRPIAANVEFPKAIYVAWAVCTDDCGVNEFIVDGSTQECQRCGRLMFRTDVRRYILKETNAA